MYPLIEIKTVPIEIEVKTTRAKLEYGRGTAEMEISRDQSGISIKSRPIRLNIDTFTASNFQPPRMSTSSTKEKPLLQQASYQATATYAQQEQQLLLNAHIDGEEAVIPTFLAATQRQTQVQAQAQVQAQNQPSIHLFQQQEDLVSAWSDGDIQIRYEMDKLNFDFRLGLGDFNFVPGDIEISVKQQPDLIIKYLGGPLYVPPSADPDYVPVDVQA